MVIHPMVIMGIQTYSGYKNPRLIPIGGYKNRIPPISWDFTIKPRDSPWFRWASNLNGEVTVFV